jgi:hypothetical protein
MKAVLHETDLVCYTKRNEQTKQIELVEESVVSDRMPDIGLLGGTNANVVLRVKKAEDGVGILAGDLIATVCYIPDGSESFQSVEVTIPWEAEFESENITTQTILVGDVSIGNVDVRMMNPRKVQVKLQLNVRLLAFEKENLILHHDMDENPAIQVRKEIKDYSNEIDELPRSNVFKYIFENGSWIAVRPSGTEPKIKFYYCIKGDDKIASQKMYDKLKKSVAIITEN